MEESWEQRQGPVDDRGPVVLCCSCDERIEPDDDFYDADGGYLCASCLRDAAAEALAYAVEHCTIAKQLPRYDPSRYFAPTREEYEAGNREAYTPNSYGPRLRHEYTNYDALIRSLSKNDPIDQMYYTAIRKRIEALIDAKLAEMGLERPSWDDVPFDHDSKDDD